jgi:hypothetical protein
MVVEEWDGAGFSSLLVSDAGCFEEVVGEEAVKS